jgi:RND family efflux transporter MFP subunit
MRRSAFLLLLAGVSCRGAPESSPPRAAPQEVAVLRLTSLATESRYAAPGVVRAVREAELATRLMGTVERVLVRAGDRVAQGQVVLTLDAASADAAIRQARAGHDLAERTLRRMERLVADSAAPLAQLDAARAAEAQASSQVRAAEVDHGYASLRAPFAGTVTARLADPGDLAAPGRVLLRVADATAREIVVGVPDDVAAGIRPGLVVPVRLGAGERRAEAKVTAVVPGAEAASRTVEVRLAAPAGATAGTTAVAEFPGAVGAGIQVPDSVVVRRGQLVGVYLLAPDSTVRLRWIRVGRIERGRTEVLAGLVAGDLVAAQPASLRDGAPARPRILP